MKINLSEYKNLCTDERQKIIVSKDSRSDCQHRAHNLEKQNNLRFAEKSLFGVMPITRIKTLDVVLTGGNYSGFVRRFKPLRDGISKGTTGEQLAKFNVAWRGAKTVECAYRPFARLYEWH